MNSIKVQSYLDVVFQLSRDWDDRSTFGNGTLYEFHNLIVLLFGLRFFHQIDFILQNQNMLQFHDFNGSQVLGCLGLWAWFIASNEQESSVHDGGTVQHCCHENVVTRAIDKAHMTNQLEATRTWWPITWKTIVFTGTARCITCWPWTFWIVAFEYFGICVTWNERKMGKIEISLIFGFWVILSKIQRILYF